MTKRRDRRYARRLQVRFWKHGDERPHSAYTTNVSNTGMFIGTSSPLPPGSRVRIELLRGEDSFMLEGEVVHAARVSPLLRQLKDSGMGVRFLTLPELISEILPAASRAKVVDPAEAPRVEPEPPDSGEAKATAEPAEAAEPAPPAEDAPAAGPGPPPTSLEMRQGRVLTLRFESLPHFLKVMQRDIAEGALFVPNAVGVAVDERVEVEIHLPPPVSRQLRLAGRVVHIAEGGPGEENLLSGVGVQISEPEIVSRRLQEMIYAE